MTPFFILSAASATLPDDMNNWRHMLLKRDLEVDGISYKEATGSYRGRQEQSVLVPASQGLDSERAERVLKYARHYQQQNILFVAQDGEAHFVFPDTSEQGYYTQHAGSWQHYRALDDRERDYTEVDGLRYVAL